MRRTLEFERTNLACFFNLLGDRQRIELTKTFRGRVNDFILVCLNPIQPAAAFYPDILAGKDAASTRIATEEHLARDQPQLRPILGRLNQTRELAGLAFQTPGLRQRDGWTRRIRELQDQKEALEAELARRKPAIPRNSQRIPSAEQIASGLPPGIALVDFTQYYDEITLSGPPKNLKRTEKHLLAFIVRRGRPPVCVTLGASKAIEHAIEGWRKSLLRGDVRARDRAGTELRGTLWEPLQGNLAGETTILVSPDGPLARFPLAALPGRSPGSFLIEEVAIGYLSSGRQAYDLFGRARTLHSQPQRPQVTACWRSVVSITAPIPARSWRR